MITSQPNSIHFQWNTGFSLCSFISIYLTLQLIMRVKWRIKDPGSQLVFPFSSLQVDPNSGVAMYESDDIIKYLVTKYGVC